MKKSIAFSLLLGALACVAPRQAWATANYVYHEQTGNFVASPTCPSNGTDTGCGRYIENADADAAAGFQIFSTETFSLHYKVEFQFFTNEVRVYYTTDGSAPCGSFGAVGNVTQPNNVQCGAGNTTQVVLGNYNCTFSDNTQGCQIVDVVAGSIPAQAPGTTVKYIVSAWHNGGGPEVFANSGNCCTPFTSSSEATVFFYNVIAPPPIAMQRAVSRVTHTGIGPFDIDLGFTGHAVTPPNGVECRNIAGNATMVFTFNNTVVSGTAGVTAGTGTVSGTPIFSGNTMTIALIGLTNPERLTVTLTNVTDNFAQVLPPTAVDMGVLAGDTTGDGSVNSGDIGQTKSRSGQSVDASNFRSDVTFDGNLNSGDIGLVKSRSGTALP